MSVCAVMLVKDEADIIEVTVRHLATQVDQVLVADNGSTDGTHEILHALSAEYGDAVKVRHDDEVGYYQSQKMTAWAREAGEQHGHEWVVPCDADEIWYSDHGRVGDLLGVFPVDIAEAVLFDHVATAGDPDEPDPTKRLGWHRWDPGRLPKVAVRVRPGLVIEQGNHGAHYPGPVTRMQRALVIRHFPYRSVEQMVSKVRNGARAYEATDLPRDMGQHWRDYGDILEAGGEGAIGEIFRMWFQVQDPDADSTLIYDPAPVHR